MEGSGQLHAPATLPPVERAPGTYWIGGWIDSMAKRNVSTPAANQTPVYTD